MSTKTKHQRRAQAVQRVDKLIAQCGIHAIARHLKNRGYSFEEAHTLLLGKSPAERQQAIRNTQQQQLIVDTTALSVRHSPLVME